jgi:DNA-binding response OmpR family regulator
MDDQRLTVLQSGADDFITKPCDEYELLEKMRVHLNIAYDYEEMNGNESDALVYCAADDMQRRGPVLSEFVAGMLEEVGLLTSGTPVASS